MWGFILIFMIFFSQHPAAHLLPCSERLGCAFHENGHPHVGVNHPSHLSAPHPGHTHMGGASHSNHGHPSSLPGHPPRSHGGMHPHPHLQRHTHGAQGACGGMFNSYIVNVVNAHWPRGGKLKANFFSLFIERFCQFLLKWNHNWLKKKNMDNY